jgi:tRNA-specific 2-thiouridylase
MKAIIAMSGGVDSSVAAYLLKKQGYEVIGLSFELWDKRDLDNSDVCCSIETIRLAKSVAENLGIKHYSVDVRDTFYTKVVEEFCESYISGITPNPCILCNKFIKFDFLMKKADELGADFIATGHYAQIVEQRTKDARRYLLKKGVDPVKDQSYVLYVMKQEELAKTVFPLGEMNKDQTRSIARELGLATAMRAESQEICFVGNEKYADFMKGFAPEALQPGPIVDTAGKVVGRHEGIAFYTIGQRRGLGISSPVPRYVADIDRNNSTIVIGSREDAMKLRFKVKEMNWIAIPCLTRPVKTGVKIRSTTGEMPATITPADNGYVLVEFDEPQWAPARRRGH